MTNHNHPFEWFKLTDYAVSPSISDWVAMLSRRADWRESVLTIYPDGVPMEDKTSVRDDYLAAVLPSNLGAHPSASDHKSPTPPPLIVDITEDCSGGQLPISDFEMQGFGTRILAVNPNASDRDLTVAFENWRKERRKRASLPIKRPGRPSANFEVTARHLISWREHNVLGALDLDFCAKIFGIDPLKYETLGIFLGCKPDDDPKEHGRVARATAKEAMKCISLLQAQIQARNSVRKRGKK
jgi:predicted DNA-binding transcriptional regulator AlpA